MPLILQIFLLDVNIFTFFFYLQDELVEIALVHALGEVVDDEPV